MEELVDRHLLARTTKRLALTNPETLAPTDSLVLVVHPVRVQHLAPNNGFPSRLVHPVPELEVGQPRLAVLAQDLPNRHQSERDRHLLYQEPSKSA